MNSILPYYLFTGFFFMAALEQLFIGIYSKRKRVNLAFGILAFIGAIYEINMICMLKAGSSQDYIFFIYSSRILLISSGIAQIFFVSRYCRIYFKHLLIFVSIVSILTLIITFLNPLQNLDINFIQIHTKVLNSPQPIISFNRNSILVLLLNYILLVLFFCYTMLVLIRFYKIGEKTLALLLISSFCIKFTIDLTSNFHTLFDSVVFNSEYSSLVLIVTVSLLHSLDFKKSGIFKQQIEFESEMKEFKNEAVRYIVHDFKIPLNKLSSISPDDTKETILDVAKVYSTNMLNLAVNLLEVYKFNEGALKLNTTKLDVTEVINDALRSLATIANNKNIEFELNFDNDCILEADGDLLRIVFMNLLYTTIKCLADNDKIIITSSLNHTGHFQLTITAPQLNISTLNLSNLFESNKLQGNDIKELSFSTGISMMFCKIVVDSHSGEIGMDNNDGKTTIRLNLPNAQMNSPFTYPNETKSIVANKDLITFHLNSTIDIFKILIKTIIIGNYAKLKNMQFLHQKNVKRYFWRYSQF